MKRTFRLKIFHAGTSRDKNKKLISIGGRVLNATVVANDLKSARKIANNTLNQLDWENIYFRTDIGNKIID